MKHFVSKITSCRSRETVNFLIVNNVQRLMGYFLPNVKHISGGHVGWQTAPATPHSAPEMENQIKQYLQDKGIRFQEGFTCFSCTRNFEKVPDKEESATMQASDSNLSTSPECFINRTNGHFYCTDSDISGSWEQFQNLNKFREEKLLESYTSLLCDIEKSGLTSEEGLMTWDKHCESISQPTDKHTKQLLKKCQLEMFSSNFLHQFDVRVNKEKNVVLFPWQKMVHPKPELPRGVKALKSFDKEPDEEILEVSPHCATGVFGAPNKAHSKTIVLTENVHDTMAINFASTKYRAICLWHGASYLPVDVLPFLEHFSNIVLWFKNSLLSTQAAHSFARKLNLDRCKIVRANSGSPFQCLRNGENLDVIIGSANPMNVKNIIKFEDVKYLVRDELENHVMYSGTKWKRFPYLSKILKGHRQGELTILTGPTGCGKTTLASELSIDLAIQGVSTLWGSFEISNTTLLKCMLKQFSHVKLESHMDKFAKVSESFKQLPLYLMTYRGPQSMAEVLKTIEHACYVNDVQHVVIDNLQFMLGNKVSMDRFTFQDHVIGQFRKLATTKHVHVTIIIHPRKEDPHLPLHMSSIFGSAKSTQEADNVLILQSYKSGPSSETRKYLEVTKNRYDGDLGKMALYYNKETLCMSKPNQEN